MPRSNERADLALVGTSLEGFEIKTARDTLQRLPRQIAAYGRIFDRCTAVLAERHLEDSTAILPEWWGLIVIAESPDRSILEQLREPGQNPELDGETLVRLLWKEETRLALEELTAPVEPRATRHALWHQLLEVASPDQLRDAVRRALIGRDASLARMPSNRFEIKRLPADR